MSGVIALIEKYLPKNKINIFGKSSLMMSPVPYFLMTVLFCNYFLRSNPNPFIFMAIAFSVFPLLD